MICERVEEYLSALLDNDLDPKTKTEVEEHLRHCSACTETYRDLSLLVTTSAGLESLNPPERVFRAVRDRVQARERRAWFRPRNIGWVLVPALATAVLMLVVFPHEPTRPNVALERPASQPAEIASSLSAGANALAGGIAVESIRPSPASRTGSGSNRQSAAQVRPTQSTNDEVRMTNSSLVIPAHSSLDLAPAPTRIVAVSAEVPVPAKDVRASLTEVQQGLEEIEAALYANPGNPQVISAYRATYRKGQELKSRYLTGAR